MLYNAAVHGIEKKTTIYLNSSSLSSSNGNKTKVKCVGRWFKTKHFWQKNIKYLCQEKYESRHLCSLLYAFDKI